MDNRNLFHGARIRLTAPRAEDAHTWARWYEDSDFARLFDSRAAYPRSLARMSGFVDDLMRPTDSYPFAVRPHDSDEMIGYADIDAVSWTHRHAWVSIAIGDPRYRGLGYGREVMTLVIDYAFRELNLHRLQLTVFSYNAPAIRLYERIGFVREGVHREALLRDGERHDMLLYGLLSREWFAERG
ncbi:MAG: GNAT family protein [Chloroflexota bacterium]|nr:GNAT family protein [Chloroflexota bacterium]